jgi:crescentin
MMLLSKLERARAGGRRNEEASPIATPEMEQAASVIGERYEVLHGGLDKLTVLAEQLRTLEPLLSDMRKPLAAEFEARRDDYIELIGLRAAATETAGRIEALGDEARELRTALEAAEARKEELAVRLAEATSHAQDGRIEIDRLRTALSQAEAQVQSLAATERDNAQRILQQEEDLQSLRQRLDEADAGRAEAVTARARAERDQALLADENEALKKRSEEVVVEIARLARVEASLDSQLAAERARASGEQVEAARTIRSLETQAEAVRTEAAGLQVRLDTLTARAERLETLNADLGHALTDAQSAGQSAERAVSHLQVDLKRARDRIRELEAGAEDSRQRTQATESARLAAVDRAEHLAKAAAANEKALSRSEERTAKLQLILAALKVESDERVKALTDHNVSMRSSLEGVRAESAITAAALDAARRERAGMEPSAPAQAPATA